MFSCSFCHLINISLCSLFQLEVEAKGTRHHIIAAGPESYVRILTDKEETVAGMGQGKGAQSHKENKNKELSLPTSLDRIRHYRGSQTENNLVPSSYE